MGVRSTAAVIVLCSSLVAVGSATAQTGGRSTGTTTNGLFGQNSVGGNASTQVPGSSGSNSSSSGSSGSGSTGGNSGAGMDTTNVALTSQTMRPTVTTTQQRGAFVGADSADTTNARSLQGNARGGNNLSGLAQLQNLFSQGMQNVNRGNQTTQPQVRVSLKLGFRPLPVTATSMPAFESRITKLPAMHWIGPAAVTLEGRTAVLRGKVASEDDRQLAESLAMMEPEVQAVRNELTVDSAAIPDSATPGSSSLGSPAEALPAPATRLP